MASIFLARHGETAWNALGKLQGHTDIALNDVGRTQARALASAIAGSGITSVLTSDLSRAMETGQIVAEVLGLAPPVVDPDLRERRFGVFEGLTRDECANHHPEAWQAWLSQHTTPPGGEPRARAIDRMAGALGRIATRATGPVLVVSHGGVMRLWLMELLGGPIAPISNGTTYQLDHDGAAFRARAWDDRSTG